jgi:acyl-CoA dehydrogenase
MSEDLEILSAQTRRFLAKEFVPHRERWDREGIVDRGAWMRAGEAGLLCASIPTEYGGGGGTSAHEVVIAEELVRADLAGGFGAGNSVHSQIVAHYILAYGSEDQKARWLPQMATGRLIGAIAMTEPGAGSDLKAIRTSARRDDRHYIVTGQKTFITNGQNADLIIVVARTSSSGSSKDVSLIVVEAAGAEGFHRGRNLEKIGMHAQDTSELFFDEVRVPAENLLGGTEGLGFGQLVTQLAWERLSCALNAVAGMERAVDLASNYVKDRKAFGQPLLSFQNTQFKLAEAKTHACIGRSFVDQLMVRLLNGDLDATLAAMAKWWTTDMLCKVVDDCVQMFGGYGYMTEYPIARLFADARVQKIYAGTNEIMKTIIARSI